MLTAICLKTAFKPKKLTFLLRIPEVFIKVIMSFENVKLGLQKFIKYVFGILSFSIFELICRPLSYLFMML